MYFRDRVDAGKKLANLLDKFKGQDVVVYALPRGGVVVGAEVVKTISAPLDLIITRKIGHPNQPEYAIGAVAEDGHCVFNKEELLDIDESYIISETEKQKAEARRRRETYLGKRKPILCNNKIAILVDDGIATGLTIKVAIKELKTHYRPKKIIVAVPVIPKDVADELEADGETVIATDIDKEFLGSIGVYYQDFPPVEDQLVINLMKETEKLGNKKLSSIKLELFV